MTSALYDLDTREISSSSVETTNLLMYFDLTAASIEYAINGFPASNFIFFLGIPLLPPLAGMIAKIFILLY